MTKINHVTGCGTCPFNHLVGINNDILVCLATEDEDGDCLTLLMDRAIDSIPDWCPLKESEIIIKLT
jgi:hypothetical protein